MSQFSATKLRVAVLMTCFNRREMTLAALESLQRQTGVDDLAVTVYLLDDNSRDGTATSVAEKFPAVKLLHGDGSNFWNGGMRKAFAAAMADRYDAYLWFNDDTHLMEDALHRLATFATRVQEAAGPAIVVGSVANPDTGERSYGGVRKRASGLRLDFVAVEPSATEGLRCDTMNGNFTLIPDAIARRLGNLDGAFRHQLSDFDYGLRATEAGLPVIVAPGYFGYCTDNPATRTWRDGGAPLSVRWKHLMSPKGAPPKEWLLYTRRHFGWRWPFYMASPYIKVLFK